MACRNGRFPMSKSWYSPDNPDLIASLNEAFQSCKRPNNCCCCCRCNSCKPESHKFVEYADASQSASILDDKPQLEAVVCTKANVSVQCSESSLTPVYSKLNGSFAISPSPDGSSKIPPDSCRCSGNAPDYCNCSPEAAGFSKNNNSFSINQPVPLVSTCIKRTEICNSVCPASHCFNFEKRLELAPCDKNVNINVEVKVKRKKKKKDEDKCRPNRSFEDHLKPCVCFKEPDEEASKTCNSGKKSAIICCDNNVPKSKLFNMLNNLPPAKCRSSNDEKGNVFVCKPLTPDDFSSMIKSCDKDCAKSAGKSVLTPSECVRMFKKKYEKEHKDKSQSSMNGRKSFNSDVALEKFGKRSSSKHSKSSQRKYS